MEDKNQVLCFWFQRFCVPLAISVAFWNEFFKCNLINYSCKYVRYFVSLRLDTVLKVSDADSLEFDDEVKGKNSADPFKSIKEEWADFIASEGKDGANTQTPPSGSGTAGLSRRSFYSDDQAIVLVKAVFCFQSDAFDQPG